MKKLVFLALLGAIVISCAKWVNVDITNDEIILISPIENQKDSLQNKTFVWEEIEGVKEYRIQIVSASFDSIYNFVLDSTVDFNSFSTTLNPGNYQWRVRGENEDFQSKWSVRTLTISSTASLNGQSISNMDPTTGTNSNLFSHTFTWTPLLSAENYLIKVLDKNSVQLAVDNTTLSNYTYSFPTEGIFTVSMQAINSLSASLSELVVMHIDTTAPAKPTLTFPVLDTLKSFPQTFKWTKPGNVGSSIRENLLVASDSLMNTILLDTTFTESSQISLDSIATTGKLFWKINRTDAAGNALISTESKKFFIQ